MRNPHDHCPAVYKLREHNSYPIAPSMRASVILASSLVIPAQAGIQGGRRSSPLTGSYLLDYV